MKLLGSATTITTVVSIIPCKPRIQIQCIQKLRIQAFRLQKLSMHIFWTQRLCEEILCIQIFYILYRKPRTQICCIQMLCMQIL